MVKLSETKYTKHGLEWRHVGAGPAEIQRCKVCNDDLVNKHSKFPYERGWVCKHCKTKLKHGVSDPKTCFQGSVITLED